MPELPELEVVQEVLNRRIAGQTITAAEAIPPGAAIVRRDLTGLGGCRGYILSQLQKHFRVLLGNA